MIISSIRFKNSGRKALFKREANFISQILRGWIFFVAFFAILNPKEDICSRYSLPTLEVINNNGVLNLLSVLLHQLADHYPKSEEEY